MSSRSDRTRLEHWLVLLISFHSAAVGVLLLGFTDWAVAFGGWGSAQPRFFAQQAGVFHVVVAAGYLYEYFAYRGFGLLLLAKSTAVVFLVGMILASDRLVWVVPISALADALMAVAVLVVRRRTRTP